MIRVMKIKNMLPRHYIELGFELSKLGEKSLALKYKGNTIFIFGSYLDIKEGFIPGLCDYYLKPLRITG
jgi:hypothetical protein